MSCYLIENKNGFEQPLRVGTRGELEEERSRLETEAAGKPADARQQAWGGVSYYIVPKREWDIENCPLIPVDYS